MCNHRRLSSGCFHEVPALKAWQPLRDKAQDTFNSRVKMLLASECQGAGKQKAPAREMRAVPKAEQLWARLELEGFIAKCSIRAFEGLCILQEGAFQGETQLQTRHCTHTATPEAQPWHPRSALVKNGFGQPLQKSLSQKAPSHGSGVEEP